MDFSKNVKLVKFPEFDDVDKELFSKTVNSFIKKVGEDCELQLSLKQYHKGGLRAQHEVHGKVFARGKSFFAEENGWQLLEVIQSVLHSLEKEVKKERSMKG